MTAEIGLLAKAGEGLFNDIYKEAKGKLKAGFQKFDWHTAQKYYYQKIEKDYGFTRILGKHEPIPLEGIFTDVFLLDTPTALQRFDIAKLQNDFDAVSNEENRLSGLDLVKEGKLHRLYILGKPGAGKTTFLKYIALKAAQSEIKKIPIFVSLYDWAKSGLELMPFLVKQFDICQFPDSQPLIEYILKTGLAIVLFDGLDETKQEDGKRDKIIDDIREFSRKYDESQILVTCRIAASDYTFEEFTYLEVADFNDEQINYYVKKWFVENSEKYEQFKSEFGEPENYRLREMANTPLLLSLLCLSFEETGAFPQRRVEIYEEGIRALLTKWDSSRNIKRDEIYKGLSLGRKQQMFGRVAAQTFEKNEYFVSKQYLADIIVEYLSQLPNALPKEDIDGETILQSIESQHSIFIERAYKIYSFSHLTFQEYFVAKYTLDNSSSGTLKRLLSINNLIDNRWSEVILNTVSLMDNADTFFQIIQSEIQKNILSDEKITKFIKWAEKKTQILNENFSDRIFNYFYAYLEVFLYNTHKSNQIKANPINKDDLMFLTELAYGQGLLSGLSSIAQENFQTESFSSRAITVIFDADIVLLLCLEESSSHKNLKLFIKKWEKLVKECETIDENISKFIQEISLLSEDKNSETVNKIEAIKLLLKKYREIGYDWKFTEQQNLNTLKYLKLNRVLPDLLQLAVVSDRNEIIKNYPFFSD